jgi:cold shock CspA family protein
MARFIIAIAALLLMSATTPLCAQDTLSERMSSGRLGDVAPGSYLAADTVKFSLAPDGYNFLLRFDGDPEVFVLYSAHASMGGRELKYDSGDTAMQVAGWGGITLYTDSAPNGLPAVRAGDAVPPSPANVSLGDMQNAAGDEAEHLAYTRGLRLNFTADWGALAANAAIRAFAFDTLENTVRGLDRFSITAFGREALAKRVDTVMVALGGKPTLGLNGKTLVVTFNPDRGYDGRASSRAIARALGQVFPKK